MNMNMMMICLQLVTTYLELWMINMEVHVPGVIDDHESAGEDQDDSYCNDSQLISLSLLTKSDHHFSIPIKYPTYMTQHGPSCACVVNSVITLIASRYTWRSRHVGT